MRFLLSIVLLAAAWTAGAQGTSQAILGYNNNGIAGSFTGTAGWTFEVTNAITVTELGCLANFFPNNSPATQIQVGLWAPNGSLLASNTIASTSTLVDLSRYESVTPVLLISGQTYHIGVYYPGGSFGLDVAAPAAGGSVITSPDILSLNAAMGTNGFASPPILQGTLGAAILGPNFRYTGGVPEPSSCLLLTLGASLLAARRRNRHS
jgi:hypothetical protein